MTGTSSSDRAERLKKRVLEAYSAAAACPAGRHPFPVGRRFALSLGYPAALLDSVPAPCVEAFTGVSSVSVLADIPPGSTVLDLGCGAGLDTIIAARRAGPSGRALGVDFSASMLDRARHAATTTGGCSVLFCRGTAEHLPLCDAAVDVALVNGIFNLNPARDAVFRELARVVRRGGAVFAAELVLTGPLPAETVMEEANWFA